MASVPNLPAETKSGRDIVQAGHEDGEVEGLKLKSSFLASGLSVAQGAYYFGTGVWPLIDMDSFESVTGPKTDDWLVKTVGGLVAVIGSVLVMAGLRRRVTPETAVLAVGSAGGLATIEIPYSLKGRISAVYLLDVVAEFFIVALWYLVWRRSPGKGTERLKRD